MRDFIIQHPQEALARELLKYKKGQTTAQAAAAAQAEAAVQAEAAAKAAAKAEAAKGARRSGNLGVPAKDPLREPLLADSD
ncbi:hypothetical protein FOA52_001282 [Chlamydomonas sp. UWO 241]|nr:hypothetical protein FOA52_001282 [Chlamydomonas sp. UWO 241]